MLKADVYKRSYLARVCIHANAIISVTSKAQHGGCAPHSAISAAGGLWDRSFGSGIACHNVLLLNMQSILIKYDMCSSCALQAKKDSEKYNKFFKGYAYFLKAGHIWKQTLLAEVVHCKSSVCPQTRMGRQESSRIRRVTSVAADSVLGGLLRTPKHGFVEFAEVTRMTC